MQVSPYGKRMRWTGWIYVIPGLALFSVFLLFPIIYNVINSLSQGDASIVESWSLQNYFQIADDDVFWIALRNSLTWVVCTTLIQMALGFFIALLLERVIVRGRAIYRTILFLPMVVTPTVIAIVFQNIYAPQYGLVYGLFQHLGMADRFPDLLSSQATATYAVIAVNVWQWVGYYVLLYSVGIATIDDELIAAAEVDGASVWAQLRYIFFPLVRSTHLSLLIFGPIQALQQFPLIYLMTTGGPANATQVMATYIFQKGFLENNMHYASAISIILLILALVIAGGELLVTRGEFAIGRR
ncbi:MAG: sugar ABC transporter permease [Ktedonobacteraceae bacterium]|nr:sugar ABC transporter permease [Ktedonobacteraceae bacterium]